MLRNLSKYDYCRNASCSERAMGQQGEGTVHVIWDGMDTVWHDAGGSCQADAVPKRPGVEPGSRLNPSLVGPLAEDSLAPNGLHLCGPLSKCAHLDSLRLQGGATFFAWHTLEGTILHGIPQACLVCSNTRFVASAMKVVDMPFRSGKFRSLFI